MRMAMIGLGRMGYNMATRLQRGGHEVVAFNRNHDKSRQLAADEGATAVESVAEAVGRLQAPRVVWLMLPAGDVTDEHIAEVLPLLQPGDVLIDGGNSMYKDDQRRSAQAAKAGVHYLDVGTSGGIWGLQVGYCLMIGGEKQAFDLVEPLFATLAPSEGYLYCGPSGAGHFVKMIHNGIEYGMMQAYAEGFAIMQASSFGGQLDFGKVSHLWNQGSVVRSWLLELLELAFGKSPRLENLQAYVDDSGEGRWTVDAAVELAVPAPVLSLSLMERFRSRQENDFGNRVLAALRNEFGGHAVKTKG